MRCARQFAATLVGPKIAEGRRLAQVPICHPLSDL
jgi:hypothetical protein